MSVPPVGGRDFDGCRKIFEHVVILNYLRLVIGPAILFKIERHVWDRAVSYGTSGSKGDRMRETRIGLVQSPLQVDLDRIAEDLLDSLHVDMALISIQHNNALVSLGVSSTVLKAGMNRTHSADDTVCLHVVRENTPLMLADARIDPMTSSLGCVKAGIVAGYIGVPIQNAEIGAIGAICGISGTPRDWSEEDLRYLKALAGTVENLILREMYRRESADASSLATEYDNIIAAFSLVRAEATSIHDTEGRLVFANRALTQIVDEASLENERVTSIFRCEQSPAKTCLRLAKGTRLVVTPQKTASGYWVCHWQTDERQLN